MSWASAGIILILKLSLYVQDFQEKGEAVWPHITSAHATAWCCYATPAFAFKEVCPTLEGSSHSTWVLSPLRGPLAGCICGLMRRFLGALWSRPPLPLLVLHDRRLSCCLHWLTELSNYISNEAAKCEKTRQLYSLQTFFHPPRIGESSSRLSPRSKLHPSQPSRVLKAQLRALLISSPLSRLSPSDGLLHLTPLLPQRLVFIAAVWAQWHISPPAPPTPALINSFVLPSARVFPQTNCWQKHLC